MRKVTWNGVTYPSIRAAAQAAGVLESTLLSWVEKGYSCDEDTQRPTNKQTVVWNGIRYSSLSEAARTFGISRQAMWKRVQAGYVCDDDLRWHRRNEDKNSITRSANEDNAPASE